MSISSAGPVRNLLIEGWRFLPHSYALVNQFQCLELLRRRRINLYFHDVPFFEAAWKRTVGLFDPAAEAALRDIPPLPAGVKPDAIFRIAFPYNLEPADCDRVYTFGTAEMSCVPNIYIKGHVPLAEAHARNPSVIILTPSNWSRRGFILAGADEKRVRVLPHGTDVGIFHPAPADERQAMRAQANWNGFVFLSIGAMTLNKGLVPLFKAFAEVSKKHPQAQLVMKGIESLYRSKEMLLDQAKLLTEHERQAVQSRLHYKGDTLTFQDVARMHQMADAYVSPYLAEGFNLPVLEAAACGLPVICTAGGSTDDFTDESFTLRIPSREQKAIVSDTPALVRVPDTEKLVEHMLNVIEKPEIATRAAEAGPAFVQQNFTWKHVIDRMLDIIFPGEDFSERSSG